MRTRSIDFKRLSGMPIPLGPNSTVLCAQLPVESGASTPEDYGDIGKSLVLPARETQSRWTFPHLYFAPQVALDSEHRLSKIGLVHDVVAVKDGPRFVTANCHC